MCKAGANGRWAAAAGTFVELAASALVEAKNMREKTQGQKKKKNFAQPVRGIGV